MAFSFVKYTLTSGTVASPTFSYGSIDLIEALDISHNDQLEVYLNDATLTFTTDYTLNESTDEITVVGATAASLVVGDVLVVQRVTKVDLPYVDYANNSALDADDLNVNNDQLLFLIQELEDQGNNSITLSLGADCFDAQNKRICNVAVATASTDAPNLGQVVSLISGGSAATTGDGIYDEQSGDGSTTTFTIPDFPTTDIDAAKLLVHINGIKQRPGVDYTYALNGSSVPTVEFLLGAPPTGTSNIAFLTLPGVVTTTYDAATLDGSVIIDNTLDGAAIEDGTLDGDALVDSSVDIGKLDFAAGADNRFIVVDASGIPSLSTITNNDVTSTGSIVRTDLDNSSINVVQSITVTASGFTYTNSGSKTLFVLISLSSQNGGGSIILTPDGEAGITMGRWASSGSALHNNQFSFFVPPNGVVSFSVTGTTFIRQLVTQEI